MHRLKPLTPIAFGWARHLLAAAALLFMLTSHAFSMQGPVFPGAVVADLTQAETGKVQSAINDIKAAFPNKGDLLQQTLDSGRIKRLMSSRNPRTAGQQAGAFIAVRTDLPPAVLMATLLHELEHVLRSVAAGTAYDVGASDEEPGLSSADREQRAEEHADIILQSAEDLCTLSCELVSGLGCEDIRELYQNAHDKYRRAGMIPLEATVACGGDPALTGQEWLEALLDFCCCYDGYTVV